MSEAAAIIAVGLAAGTLAGIFGVGGGILFVPALVILFDEVQVVAEGTSLVAILPVVAVGALRQTRAGLVDWRQALIIGALSLGGSAIGALAADRLPERTLRLCFAGLLVVTAISFARRARAAARPSAEASP